MATAERVLRGIALLDERGPKDWRDSIDLERLDMSSPWDCVLGQLYQDDSGSGAYLRALAALGIPESTYHKGPGPEKYGFEFVDSGDEYVELTEEWLVQLSVVRDG